MYDINQIPLLIAEARRASALTQSELAARAGTSQPAIARLEAGGANVTLDLLARCAAAVGCTVRLSFEPAAPPDPVIERYKQDVDRTLLRENLRTSMDERLRSLTEWQQAGQALERAARAARAGRAARRGRPREKRE